jgi:hypothetical protein
MKYNIKQLRKVQSIADLEALEIGALSYDIGYRGGTLGFNGSDVATAFDVDPNYLPHHFGAYVNYLGGGIRGALNVSGFSDKVTGRKADLLNELQDACKRAYLEAENEQGLNETTDNEGETNWDALATQRARDAGIDKAY